MEALDTRNQQRESSPNNRLLDQKLQYPFTAVEGGIPEEPGCNTNHSTVKGLPLQHSWVATNYCRKYVWCTEVVVRNMQISQWFPEPLQ